MERDTLESGGAKARDDKGKVGRKGEDIACLYLMERGHTVIDRNWRNGHLEIDIITLDKNGIHFVEVKTRRPPLQAAPQECVNHTKQKRIVRAAMAWTAKHGTPDRDSHFDIVSVVMDRHGIYTEYFPDAYLPTFI